MQGNPIKELILVLLLAATLAPVIFKLTQPAVSAPIAPAPDPMHVVRDGERTPTWIRLQFAHAPSKAVLGAEDAPLWALEATESESETDFERQVELDLGDGFLELPLQVAWPDAGPETAVTVTIEPDGKEAREVTRWGSGSLDEFLEFEWND